MTIQEMLVREDIYTILSETLEDYFRTVQNNEVSVKVEKSLLRNRYVVYPRLGAVTHRFPAWSVAKNIYDQFNVQGNVLRKIAAWGYITLCFLSGGLMASRSLYVSDKKWCRRTRYIMPCNRKIRIFDYGEGYVDAILKKGFSDACFKNEILYRSNPKYVFIPPLIKYGNRWYKESLLTGRALVRLNEPIYSEAVEKTKQSMGVLYRDTLRYEDISFYSSRMVMSIQDKLPTLQEKKNISVDYLLSVLNKCQEIIKDTNMKVPLATSHGDLQTGNIKFDENKKVTIYDWETAKERSVWFDMGKLLLYSQRKGRYAFMIEHRDTPEVKEALLAFDNNDYSMDKVVAVLVIEEMDFFVDEIIDLPGNIGTEIMDRLTDELKQTKLFS